ncbi:hypothetical protein AB834_03945 [PVC group bacterium (ex Bugula neritina AB1)]|nr:hypothetical protein AB834_03945 [PVC group bacterium (ex Bugula neritina AB1)]
MSKFTDDELYEEVDLLGNLNPEQREAASHIDGPLLLVAGAGSGKTMVITHRIAHLIASEKAKSWQILGLTFTNKAAQEMKERVYNLTDQSVLITTFHSLGARILKQHWKLAGLKEGFVIYDPSDQTAVIKECLKSLSLDLDRFKPSSVLSKLGRLKDELIDVETYQKFAETQAEKVMSQIYSLYESKLVDNNAIDFSSLIMKTVRLLGTNKELLESYQEKFRFLLVDEYQDTNYGQYELVKLLAEKYKNICIVGDPDQSIYRWRGADIRNILNFEKDYPEAKVVGLEENYRSTQNILEAANHVISNNLHRKPKNLRTARGGGEKISYFQASDGVDEADFVVQQIAAQRLKGRSLLDMAVLYRVHALSRSLEEAFIREKIPYRILGGMKFYERKEVKDLIAYLRFMVNPLDAVSFNRIVNLPKRGIGHLTVAKIQDFAYKNDLTLPEALDVCESIPGLTPRTLNKLRPFLNMLAKLKRKMATVKATEVLQELIDDIDYLDYLKMDDMSTYTTRSDNIKELFAALSEYEQKNPDGNLQDYLEEVALLTTADTQQAVEESVVLMTIHNAKGLEYGACFLIGLEEGLFPYGGNTSDEELEEERRLCYVGITRAKDELFLTSCLRRLMYGRWKASVESRFLSEIPEGLVSYLKKTKSSF